VTGDSQEFDSLAQPTITRTSTTPRALCPWGASAPTARPQWRVARERHAVPGVCRDTVQSVPRSLGRACSWQCTYVRRTAAAAGGWVAVDELAPWLDDDDISGDVDAV
jgi:hypothetical protein